MSGVDVGEAGVQRSVCVCVLVCVRVSAGVVLFLTRRLCVAAPACPARKDSSFQLSLLLSSLFPRSFLSPMGPYRMDHPADVSAIPNTGINRYTTVKYNTKVHRQNTGRMLRSTVVTWPTGCAQ